MAKIAFTKLGLKPNKEIKTIVWNEQTIEILQYLPVDEKLQLISRIINNSAEDMKFYNVGKVDMFTTLEIIYAYTNINFTEKQKEDICKLYDLLVSSGLYSAIMKEIPKAEKEWIEDVVMDSISNIYNYQNSVLGILDSVTQDYSNLNLDAESIQKKIADPENLELLKSIMTRLG